MRAFAEGRAVLSEGAATAAEAVAGADVELDVAVVAGPAQIAATTSETVVVVDVAVAVGAASSCALVLSAARARIILRATAIFTTLFRIHTDALLTLVESAAVHKDISVIMLFFSTFARIIYSRVCIMLIKPCQ